MTLYIILWSIAMLFMCFLFYITPNIFFWWIEKGSKKYFLWRGKFNKRMFDLKDRSEMREI